MRSSPSSARRLRLVPTTHGCFGRCINFPRATAIAIILIYVFISGLIMGITEYMATSAIIERLEKHSKSLLLMYCSYAITVLGLFLYPLFGFMADVFCGRYLAVAVSAFVMSLGILLMSTLAPLHSAFWDEESGSHVWLIMLMAITYMLGILGVAAFQANVVQFGLDQLMDQSSRCLSLFLHMLVWVRHVGYTIIIVPLTLQNCDHMTDSSKIKGSLQFLPLAVFVLLTVLPFVILIAKRDSFYRELGHINPYKMVVKIICYALKNRHPQRRRSAFFYYYGLNPGRLDFAKVHYGGPYDTEDVENVKTLLQILRVLISIGPIFILKVSVSYFMYQHFVQHFVNSSLITKSCYTLWSSVGSGNLMNIVTVLLFPVYIFVVFKVLKNIPRMLLRLLVGFIMTTLCLVCVLLMEVVGHIVSAESSTNKTLHCALAMKDQTDNTLGMPWPLLIIPNVLYGLATPIIYTTVFEFISAQSPRSMAGLLIGTFFFMEGVFLLVGTLIAVPFSLGKLWHSRDDNPTTPYPIASVACEIWYLVIAVACGILGVIVFSISACKYKYRKREETPFPQSDIEDIITRNIEEDTRNLLDVASVEAEGHRTILYST